MPKSSSQQARLSSNQRATRLSAPTTIRARLLSVWPKRLWSSARAQCRRQHDTEAATPEVRDNMHAYFRVFGCVHVCTGTLVLGICHLILHVFALGHLLFLMSGYTAHSHRLSDTSVSVPIGDGPDAGSLLLTNTKEYNARGIVFNLGINKSLVFNSHDLPDRLHSGDVPSPLALSNNGIAHFSIFGAHVLSASDAKLGFLIVVCSMCVTVFLVVGVIRRQPLYLMPYFCLQVFDFCLSCLTLISFFSLVPNAASIEKKWPRLPIFDRLHDHVDTRCLVLIFVAVYLLIMVTKICLISMVWSCYRYLLLCQARPGNNFALISHVPQPSADSRCYRPPPEYYACITGSGPETTDTHGTGSAFPVQQDKCLRADHYTAEMFPEPPPSYTVAVEKAPAAERPPVSASNSVNAN